MIGDFLFALARMFFAGTLVILSFSLFVFVLVLFCTTLWTIGNMTMHDLRALFPHPQHKRQKKKEVRYDVEEN